MLSGTHAGLLIGVQHLAIVPVADGVHGDLPAALHRRARGALDRLFGRDGETAILRVVVIRREESGAAGAERAVCVELDAAQREHRLRAGGRGRMGEQGLRVGRGREGVDAQLEAAVRRQLPVDLDRAGANAHLVDLGQPLGEREILGAQDRLFKLGAGVRRNRPFHEAHRLVDEDAGGLALAVAHDAPARRIGRVAGDGGLAHGLAVDPDGVAVDPPQQDGAIGRDLVEDRVGGKLLIGESVLIPAAAGEPRALVLAGCRGDLAGALLRRGAAAQIDRDPRQAEAEQVRVRVGQRGHDGAPGELDDAGLGADERGRGGVISDRDDEAAANRQGARVGMRRILGQHVAAAKDQVRGRLRRDGDAAAEEDDDEQAHAPTILRAHSAAVLTWVSESSQMKRMATAARSAESKRP
jgi:hypothetical protein